MKLNRICMTALLLGAAAIATPAFAPAFAEDQAAADASAKTNVAGQAAMDDTKLAPSGNASTSNQAAASSSSSDIGIRSAANANVDAVGTTSKKYRRGNRNADFAKEQEITKQLNSQAASAAAPSGNRL